MPELPVYILGIAPYEGMKTVMERSAQSYPNVILDAFVGDLEEGAAIARSNLESSYDCIISRGGTAEIIREMTDIPVVEIPLSVYDVLRALKLAENYQKKYAIVGFASITHVAKEVCTLIESRVDIFTVSSVEQTNAVVQQLRMDGYTMVVGDMVTHTACRAIGMETILITSGVEALQNAIEQAVYLSTRFRRMRQENRFLQCIAQKEQGSLVVLDEQGEEYYTIYSTPGSQILSLLQEKLPEIPRSGVLHFNLSSRGNLYKVTAQRITLGQERFYLFYYQAAKIPLRSSQAGIRSYTSSECAHLLGDSFFSISGALGAFESTLTTVAATRQPVMILGEMGTGRVQLARYLYLKSNLRNYPLVVIDCELATEKSWEFLFNHHRSPFNDTMGTIYFQNLTKLPPKYAAELLSVILDTNMMQRQRFLFSSECSRDGVLSGTAQLFLQKLGCMPLRLPTLRSRQEEIPSLACLYLSSLNQKYGKQISGFEPRAMELLRSYDWPNNYTQFRQILESLAAKTETSYIHAEDVSEALAQQWRATDNTAASSVSLANRVLNDVIREAISQTLAANGGNQSAAARALGISRTTMWRFLNQ